MANNVLQILQQVAKDYGLDWRALASVAHAESGLDPGSIGDNNSSFGLFQLHQGGALGNMSTSEARQYLDPWKNASFAATQMRKMGLSGLKGDKAVDAMVRRFERPADPNSEVARAIQYYKTLSGGQPLDTPTAQPTAVMGAPDPNNPSPFASQDTQRNNLLGYLMSRNSGQKADTSQLFGSVGLGLGQQQQQSPSQMYSQDKKSFINSQVKGAVDQMGGQMDLPVDGNADPSSVGNSIVKAAKNFLGVKYVWGGTSPKGFDCSGLVQYVFHKFGITTPRVSEEQFKSGKKVNQNNAQPGDLVFFRHSDGDVGHVGIYIGNGQFLHAPHTGDVVKISNLKGYGLPLAGIRRYT